MRLSVGLPSFILDKKNHMKILFAFLVLIVGIIPYQFLNWYNRTFKYDEDGILIETSENYMCITDENSTIQNIPFYISTALEFESIEVNPNEKTVIEENFEKLRPKFPKLTIKKDTLNLKKAIVVSYFYFDGKIDELEKKDNIKIKTAIIYLHCPDERHQSLHEDKE